MKLLLLYRRRWWLFYLPVLLCTALALWWSATQWKVLPPAEVVIGAGSPQGGYSMLAQRYAEQLERIGVRAEIVYSDTQKGSLERLTRAGDATSIGFAHGIYANADQGCRPWPSSARSRYGFFPPRAGPRRWRRPGACASLRGRPRPRPSSRPG
jgi:hypothetical protein